MRLAAATPTGLIAILAGWFVAEVGRQPFTAYGLLRTSNSMSPIIDAGAVATSLAIFLIVYGGLFDRLSLFSGLTGLGVVFGYALRAILAI